MTATPWSRPWPAFLGQVAAIAGRHAGGVRRPGADRRRPCRHPGRGGGRFELVPAGQRVPRSARGQGSTRSWPRSAEAARITDAAFVAATADLEPGITERELAWRIESAMRELGADGPGFSDHRRRRPARRAAPSRPDATARSRKASRSSSTWAPWSTATTPI